MERYGMILLVTAPVVKPSEPPPGISRILGAMRAHGVGCAAWDANLECLLGLLHGGNHSGDRWTARAVRNVDRNLKNIQAPKGLLNLDRYKRSVSDLNRLLEGPWNNGAVHVSLTNYQDAGLSPVKSGDLLAAAERPEGNLFYPLFSKSLGELLKVHGPSVVGFSLNYLSQALTTFAMMGFLRRTEPSLTLALGGGLVTSWMRGPGWKNPFSGLVDLMIPGSGETPLLSLAKGEKRDILPFTHNYSPFPMSDYLSPGVVIPYSASSGCYWNRCGFCPEKAEGNRFQPTVPREVIRELEDLVARWRPVLIHLLDNALSPALLRELARQRFEAPWYGFARITEQLADLDFCLALKDSGCVMLQLGLESGDQGVLDQLQKGVDLGVASRTLRNLKKAGIAAYVYLLFGTPAESEAEARQTLEFAVRHSGQIGFLNLAIFNLPAHGEEARNLSTRSFYEGDLSLYSSFAHPRGWSRGRVRSFLEKEFKRHPALSPVVKRDPPIFTSNHAPFFAGKR